MEFFKWTGFVTAGIAALICIGVAYAFFACSSVLNREHAKIVENFAPLPAYSDGELATLLRRAAVAPN